MKPARLREAAYADLEAAFQYYLREAPHVIDSFNDAIEAAQHHIEYHPGTGSPRYAELTDIPGLRHWLLDRFPYVLFYIERDTFLDVLRVLHQSMDIPEQLIENRQPVS